MGNEKPISLNAFRDNLKTYYKDSGESSVDIDTRIELLTKAAIKQNEDNNPLFFSELLNIIKVKQIKLEELVTTKRTNKCRRINKNSSFS